MIISWLYPLWEINFFLLYKFLQEVGEQILEINCDNYNAFLDDFVDNRDIIILIAQSFSFDNFDSAVIV